MEFSFKKWIAENTGAGVPPQFVLSDGTVKLYRYSHGDRGEVYRIDPKATVGQTKSYSRNDYQRSVRPRTFFYLDVDERENLVGRNLYVAEFPASEIYNLLEDPLELKPQTGMPGAYDFDKLFDLVLEAGFKGVYYKPGFHVVNLFVPVDGHATTEEEVRAKKAA
jgi:hypothetical protein